MKGERKKKRKRKGRSSRKRIRDGWRKKDPAEKLRRRPVRKRGRGSSDAVMRQVGTFSQLRFAVAAQQRGVPVLYSLQVKVSTEHGARSTVPLHHCRSPQGTVEGTGWTGAPLQTQSLPCLIL